jgi:hypothetical protein
MQYKGNIRVTVQHLDERPVSVLVGLFDDMLEVPDRLMVVQAEYECDSSVHHCFLATDETGLSGIRTSRPAEAGTGA